MKKEIKFFRCRHCGNLITFLHESGAPISCCGEPMVELSANSTDAATEKHVPVVSKEDGNIVVKVGSVVHPMLPEHYIQWIACVSGDKLEVRFLEPGAEPKAVFYDVAEGTVYEYCNLHGLWKAEF